MGRIVRASVPAPVVQKIQIGKAQAQAGEAGKDGETGKKSQGDTYLERIARYVPAEVVAFFIFVNLILRDQVDKQRGSSTAGQTPDAIEQALMSAKLAGLSLYSVSWSMILVGLVLTPLYLWSVRDPDDAQERIGVNILISMLAFPIWAYAVDAVAFRPWHDDAMASILLATFSVISGAIPANLADILWKRNPQPEKQPPGPPPKT